MKLFCLLWLLVPGRYEARTFYIDPAGGNDLNSGTTRKDAWKSFACINQIKLLRGDIVEILGGGKFYHSLHVRAAGTKQHPVQIRFAPGTYEIFPDSAIKRPLHISNTNDRPYDPKAIALLFDSAQFVEVSGNDATIMLRGKMIELFLDKSENVRVSGLRFDYHRPTVSELMITRVADDYVEANIHRNSHFSIADSVLTWIGEGWAHRSTNYWQQFDPVSGKLNRTDINASALRFIAIGNQKVRIVFKKNPGFKKGCVYQNRDVTRDCAGIFLRQSNDICLRNLQIQFMHGMGIVSQYCRNVTIDSLQVKPPEKSGRTCAAWADILHFSGCSGEIEVSNSFLSAANDDAINIHGTHLKIISLAGRDKVVARFMHEQTYGFDAFAQGDTVEFVNPATLLPVACGIVRSTQKINDKEWLITLATALPSAVKSGQVIENVSATPSVWIHDNVITAIPTRGILTTTRRKTVIERNQFVNIYMSAILVSDDASGWYESGRVEDLLITKNTFMNCGGPVINISPENAVVTAKPVHNNVDVIENVFYSANQRILFAKSVGPINILDNRIHTNDAKLTLSHLIEIQNCTRVGSTGNKIMPGHSYR